MIIFLFILIFIAFLDLYSFKALRLLLKNKYSRKFRKNTYIIFWSISLFMMILILAGMLFRTSTRDYRVLTWYYYLFGLFLVLYVPKIVFVVFHLIEDIFYGLKWIISKLFFRRSEIDRSKGEVISRSKFLTQTGLILATFPFFEFIWGMARGRFKFRVEHVILSFPNLPQSFDGFRIIQISDIHIGGFQGLEKHVEKAIEMANLQNGDFIFFTGDLVNNFAEELEGWVPVLSRLKARYGIFSILGNHDYGDYYNWPSETEKKANFEKIINAQKALGFQLLRNQSVKLSRNGEEIALVGVENWGRPPFPRYADYEKASNAVKDIPFKILLSHNPDHWDAKILGKEDVALTLSGHTHGMQLGLRIGGKEMWSAAQYMYKHWGGLYRENNQFLYVNRGFGYIGYPGRVGMPPEITVLELKSV